MGSFSEGGSLGAGGLLALVITGALVTTLLQIVGAPRAHALEICENVIRDFPGGPGRRPGATVVPVFMRQTVLNERGDHVFAISERQLADVAGDAVEFRLQIRNESPFDVGTVELHHAYRTVREGPKLISITDIAGGVYVQNDHMFVIDRIPAGQTVDLEYTLILERPLKEEVSQSALTLHDFMVLDPSSRFPQRFPETSISRHRTIIEKVGINGKEVSCFTGENADQFVLPGQQDTNVPAAESRASVRLFVPPEPAEGTETIMPEEIRDRFDANNLIVQAEELVIPQMLAETPYTVALPQTGVSMGSLVSVFFQVLIGIIIASGVYGMWIRILWRKLG